MKKGYIIFLTYDWLPIVSNLIDSVLAFSVYDIEINCINFEYYFKNERIKGKTINIDNQDFFNITKCKIVGCINTEFDYALLLDGDMIVNSNIDQIFEDSETIIQKYDCPLFAKHPHNPFDRYEYIISKITNKTPRMKWVYSNFLFITKQKWFLQKVLDTMNNIPDNEHYYYNPVPEEGIINALLAEYEIDYDLGYNYFPNGLSCVIDYYIDGDEAGKKHIQETYLDYNCPVKIYAFHGHDIKNIEYGKSVVQKLVNANK